MKIRTRMFLAFIVILGISFYALINWILDDVRPRYLETMEESMVDMAVILSSVLEEQVAQNKMEVDHLKTALNQAHNKEFSAQIYELTKTSLNTRVYVTDDVVVVVYDSDGGRDEGKDYSDWNDVYLTLQGRYGVRTSPQGSENPQEEILYVAAPVKKGKSILGVLTVCRPAGSVILFIKKAKRKIIIGGMLAAFLVMLLGFLFSTWITRPIKKLTAYARNVRDGRKTSPPKLGKSEIGGLGEAFEEMRDALEGKEYVEEYIQMLTHEMKSPLSAIKGAAELLEEDMPQEQQAQFVKNIQNETNRMQILIDRLLRLSSLESRKSLRDVDEVNAGEVVEEVIQSMKPLIDSKQISLNSELDKNISVYGERFLIRQAFTNLLNNAINFTPDNGTISIDLKGGESGLCLEIADSGPGIPDYAADRVFDRFYSLKHPETGKKGTGLGLTFVREVALLHNGEVKVTNNPSGGVRAIFTFPVS